MRFVLLDRVVALEPARRLRATKVFAPDDEYLADHFPGYPVIPGVLLTEAMGQAGGWLIQHHLGFSQLVLLVMIEHAKFRRPVLPGQELDIEAELEAPPSDGQAFVARGRARVGARLVAEARLAYRCFPLPRQPEVARALLDWAHATWARLRPEPAGDRR
jgi:3-hydroxymyristoyl/3-hydroxydecanoyl-(acyl carrier protein) dehydratase